MVKRFTSVRPSGSNAYDLKAMNINNGTAMLEQPERQVTGDVVQRVDDGLWSEQLLANGTTAVYEHNFWVDFVVLSDDVPARAGVIWTDDDWTTSHVIEAVKEADLAPGEQLWGVDVRPCGDALLHNTLGLQRWFPARAPKVIEIAPGQTVTIRYAIFCVLGETWHWDDNAGRDHRFTVGETTR
jgi:hypothetical protein